MAPFIVVVEDDHLQDGPLQELLRERFPTAGSRPSSPNGTSGTNSTASAGIRPTW